MKLNRIMLAAPKSGSGKTMLTCALVQTLKNQGEQVVSYKCGPDYIDPMFHKQVLGVPAKNLDTFFTGEEVTRELFLKNRSEDDFVVMEGVMGLFDGLGGIREEGSSYHLAKITKTPIILVVDAKGMGYSILPLIAGFLQYDPEHLIKGVLLNRMSKSYYEILAPKIEEELGIQVVGYFPNCKELHIESRHLGLVMPNEMEQIQEQLDRASKELECSVSLEKIKNISGQAEELEGTEKTESTEQIEYPMEQPVIAVAMDEAFCFYYDDNLEMLREYGAKLCMFSPIHDRKLPDCDAILFGGGYPELYAQQLSENTAMREAIREAFSKGMPMVAECGGFMYLHRSITDQDGKTFPMAGVLDGECTYRGKLVRFGYIALKESNTVTNRWLNGGTIKAHEFHYFDSSDNGAGCVATKPTTGRTYTCVKADESHWFGFPHLYYPSNPSFAKCFVEKADNYRKHFYGKCGMP